MTAAAMPERMMRWMSNKKNNRIIHIFCFHFVFIFPRKWSVYWLYGPSIPCCLLFLWCVGDYSIFISFQTNQSERKSAAFAACHKNAGMLSDYLKQFWPSILVISFQRLLLPMHIAFDCECGYFSFNSKPSHICEVYS